MGMLECFPRTGSCLLTEVLELLLLFFSAEEGVEEEPSAWPDEDEGEFPMQGVIGMCLSV